MKTLLRQFFYAASLILIGILCTVVLAYKVLLDHFPDLKPWHQVELNDDFHADAGVSSLSEYLAVEDLAFSELDRKILDHIKPQDRFRFNRFSRGSLSDPAAVQPNWNRTFVFNTAKPHGGALLLHGLSDSPYSMRSVGEFLQHNGWLVIGMRLPEHGTAPGSLRNFNRNDARAVTRIGMRYLRQQLGNERPLVIVGFSTGAALATDYALAAHADPNLPRVDGLVFMSPAFAVTPIAALAVWQARIGELFGIDKLAWQIVTPEFDPYKYNSFAVRAGDQIYRLTEEVNQQLEAIGQGKAIDGFPPTLVFQSVADATVQPSAVVTRLLDRLTANGSALVLYDVNRRSDIEPLYIANVGAWVQDKLSTPTKYKVTLLTNRRTGGKQVSAVTRNPDASETVDEKLDLAWPLSVYAISHVAIPFPPDDPVYGADNNADSKQLHIGGIELRGENDVLAIPGPMLTRLRYNPFYSYQSRRVGEFMQQIIANQSRSGAGRAARGTVN